MFLNNNEWLVNLVVELCQQFIKVEGKVVHPKININNIFRKDENQIYIGDWGCSAYKDEFLTNDHQFRTFQPPLTGKCPNWLIVPEYLPPEFLRDLDNNMNEN